MSGLLASANRFVRIALVLLFVPAVAHALTIFDFESTDPLNQSLVSGNKANFAVTTEQARSGSQSIKFVDAKLEPFESWTYDLPFAVTSGTVTVWFYDARGPAAFQPNPIQARWGGSIILEDANNPADFVAVEICDLPYFGGRYYGTEGIVDRKVSPDKFDGPCFPLRSVGWHRVDFTLGPTETNVFVDGLPATEVAGPGTTTQTLRLRIMHGSASNGSVTGAPPGFLPPGYQPNWFTTAAAFAEPEDILWVFYDDLSIVANTPAPNTHTMGFEIISGTPEYDTYAVPFPVPVPANDNVYMNGFVNQWETTTTAAYVRSGVQSASFVRNPHAFRSVAFDLSGQPAGSLVQVWFYDARGPEALMTNYGGSIILESGINNADFTAVEIWNHPYPASGDPTPGGPNYYLTKGQASGTPPNSFDSRVFGNRTVGWHRVDITLGAATSTITVDGIGDPAKAVGPGLNTNPKLRLMADSATAGGYSNWRTVNELQHVYGHITLAPYVYYDDLVIGGSAAARDWALFE